MTQSGQGEEPSARPAREGIVLPSDGGEPLLPGMTGATAGPPSGPPAPPPAAPAGGQSWNEAWGPGGPQPGPHAPWDTPGQHPRQPAPDAWSPAPAGPGPLPPEGARPPAYGGQPQPYGGQDPAYGGQDPAYGGQPQPYGGQPPAYGAQQPPYPQQGGAAPLPPAQEQATQYLPPVPAPADEGATQYLPHIPPAPADEGATQYLPPVAPGALPPEQPPPHQSEETRSLGVVKPGGPRGAGPVPTPAAHPDAQATQYIPPVPGGAERQPPAEFDNLFRGAPAGDGPAGSTQQMPMPGTPQPPGPGAPYGYAPQDPGGGGRRGGGDRRTGSRLPLLAAVGVGIAVVGIGAGALLAGGDGGDDEAKKQPVSATAPATEGSASASPSADPAREQAVALDALLADSGDSRQSVIDAVASVKSCDNLGQAAQSLRDAAKQRTELVTRLSRLSVDRLPDNAALTAALTKAWQASASADNHYAAWADQAAGKKGCKKGQARTTAQTQAGNKESGVASTEKARAAELWNVIAKKWGLTERTPVQL
ncbi:hypothetical protein [Streptomyces griseoviridis]|uniref:Uncharacterized protein n=1 Tax=Streptomyces griseoviridis TaxID=45398 RepID=A0ABT9LFI7_STRGD|nr:hypothetical protein [Streptomyces griseoviridis]MDP9682481.1 hypothetical protein [Streptomyces griseoviridis]GGS81108.1 hypothetical protein GCM10010240_13010 [Streptomyces griseoviridis]